MNTSERSTMAFQRFYTTAMALNNMAVSLLERHAYTEALEIFNDAVSIVKEVFSTSASLSQQQEEDHRQTLELLDAKLHKGAFYLAQCDQRTIETTTHHRSSSDNTAVHFCVFSEEECETVIGAALKDRFNAASERRTAFLIRVELNGKSLDDCTQKNPDFESSILLHNFATAYTCLACTESCTDLARKYCQSAYQLYTLTYSLLQSRSQQDKESNDQNEDDDDSVLEQQQDLSVSILALKNLINLAEVLGFQQDRGVFQTHLEDLGDLFLEVAFLLPEQELIAAAAA